MGETALTKSSSAVPQRELELNRETDATQADASLCERCFDPCWTMASPCEPSLPRCGMRKVHLDHKVLWESLYNKSTLVHAFSPQPAGQHSKPKIGLNGLSRAKLHACSFSSLQGPLSYQTYGV